MATIASIITMLEYSPKCEFLVENLFTPAYEKNDSELVCEIVGPESPWYVDIFSYLCHKTIPLALTPNQSKTFICRTARYTILVTHFSRNTLMEPSSDVSIQMKPERH